MTNDTPELFFVYDKDNKVIYADDTLDKAMQGAKNRGCDDYLVVKEKDRRRNEYISSSIQIQERQDA